MKSNEIHRIPLSIRLNIGVRVPPAPIVIEEPVAPVLPPVVSGPPSQRLRNKRARREVDDDDESAMTNGCLPGNRGITGNSTVRHNNVVMF